MSRPINLTGTSNNPTVAATFSGNPLESQTNVVLLRLEQLVDYPNHPYRPHSEAKLRELADSIERAGGVTQPINVRVIDANTFQVLAGRNRVNACKLLGKEVIPAIVRRNIDDDQAAIIVVESNTQREHVLPSEKAKAYLMLSEALKNKGKDADFDQNDEVTNGHLGDSLSEVAKMVSENRRQVARYLRLNYLIPEILQRVDEDGIPMRAGVALSYLLPDTQSKIHTLLTLHPGATISIAQAEELKTKGDNGKVELTENEVISILFKGKSSSGITPLEMQHMEEQDKQAPEEQSVRQRTVAASGKETLLNYQRLIGELRKDKIITAAQRRDMQDYVAREIEKAKHAAIQSYLAVIGKEEDYEIFLQLRTEQQIAETGDDSEHSKSEETPIE